MESHFIKTAISASSKDNINKQTNLSDDLIAEQSIVKSYTEMILETEDMGVPKLHSSEEKDDEKHVKLNDMPVATLKKLFVLNDVLNLDGEIRPEVIKKLQSTDRDLKSIMLKKKDEKSLSRDGKNNFHMKNGLL